MTGLDVEALERHLGRILPLLSLLIPFWLVRTMAGWRDTLAVWPALLVIGGTFAAVQFVWSNFVGFELVDIVSSVASMAAGVIVLRFWKPTEDWRFEHEASAAADRASPIGRRGRARRGPSSPDPGRVARAWMPFVLLTVTVLVWGLPAIKPWGTPAVKDWLDARLSWKPESPRLHLQVAKGEAVTGHPSPTRRTSRRPWWTSFPSPRPGPPSSWRPSSAACSWASRPRRRRVSWPRPSAGWSPRSSPSFACLRWASSPSIPAWTPCSAWRSRGPAAGSTRSSARCWAGWAWP